MKKLFVFFLACLPLTLLGSYWAQAAMVTPLPAIASVAVASGSGSPERKGSHPVLGASATAQTQVENSTCQSKASPGGRVEERCTVLRTYYRQPLAATSKLSQSFGEGKETADSHRQVGTSVSMGQAQEENSTCQSKVSADGRVEERCTVLRTYYRQPADVGLKLSQSFGGRAVTTTESSHGLKSVELSQGIGSARSE